MRTEKESMTMGFAGLARLHHLNICHCSDRHNK